MSSNRATSWVTMRKLSLLSSFLCLVAVDIAFAQSEPKPTPDVRPQSEEGVSSAQLRDLTAQYFAECMRDWEVATHMSKQEWESTCRRVVDGRVKFLLEHPR
jgi:hypothetical protein